jgi:hypothetical protein
MDKETIDKLHELEKKKCKWEQFIGVLEETHMLGACRYYRPQTMFGNSMVGNLFTGVIVDYDDDKEFIEHVLTCAKARLLQIDKEIEQL